MKTKSQADGSFAANPMDSRTMRMVGLLFRYSFEVLLAWLLLYLLVSPFLNTMPHASLIMNGMFTLSMASSIITVTRKSRLFWFAIFILAWTVILLWMDMFKFFTYSGQLASMTLALYLGTLMLTFFRYIFTARVIDVHLISAALCLYLLLGLFWGSIYSVLEAFQPGSFAGELLTAVQSPLDRLRHFQYFSFVTLTTLGYGDILPKTNAATALCQTEAIVGQFFMTVLVARLVGIQVTRQFSCTEEKK